MNTKRTYIDELLDGDMFKVASDTPTLYIVVSTTTAAPYTTVRYRVVGHDDIPESSFTRPMLTCVDRLV